MTSAESRKFFVYPLPFLKGICILGVILIHLTATCTEMSRFGGLFHALVLLNSLSRFAVPLFIVFSGFYLSLNARNERAIPFYRRTLKFLLIPYLLYSLLYALLQGLAGVRPTRLLFDILRGSAAPHLWFGLLIMQLYLLHPLLRRGYLACRHRLAPVLAALLVQIAWSVFASTLLPALVARLATTLFSASSPLAATISREVARLAGIAFVAHLGYFLGGYYLLDRAGEIRNWLRRPTTATVGVLVWFAAAAGIAASWSIPLSRGIAWAALPRPYLLHHLLTPLLSLAAFATLLSFAGRPERRPGPCRRGLHAFGLYAYGVYYLHPLFIMLIAGTFRHLTGAVPIDSAAFQLLRLFLVPTAAWFTAQLLARLPFGKYFT